MSKLLISMILSLSMLGCGGGKGEVQEPSGGAATESDDGEAGDEGDMIPMEKFDEINKTFERKRSIISRCFVEGVEAGEIKNTDSGFVRVDLEITANGDATNVKVSKSDFKSDALNGCVVDKVRAWKFTTLPKKLEYSFRYKLERF